MKILFVTDLYPIEAGETTTPLTLHNFVKEWIKQGHEVEIIKPNFLFNSFLRGKPFYKTGFYEFDGVKIFNVNYWTPFLFDVAQKFGKQGTGNRKQAVHSSQFTVHDYDVIIAHMPSGLIFANKLSLDVPLVCGVHASDIEVLTNPIYGIYFKKQLKDAYRRSKKIACRSFVLQKKFNELMPDCAHKTFVAPSGIDNAKCKVQSAKCEKGIGNREDKIQNNTPFTVYRLQFTVLTCANLIKRKNIDKLIMAVNDLDDFELKIIGDGTELKHLSRLGFLAQQRQVFQRRARLRISARVSEAKLDQAREMTLFRAADNPRQLSRRHNVEFLGRLPHEKVLEKMQKANVFILPSVNESFGMVYLEAMAAGCITVCTKNDGIDGIIKDSENGFLTEPTVEGIKETLLKIKAHENLEKIRQNSIETVKQYTPEICAKNYLENIM